MEIKKGTAASPGICIAEALVLDSEDCHAPRRTIRSAERAHEMRRVRRAFQAAIQELTSLEASSVGTSAGKIKDIFAVHLRFLRDRSLRREITETIQVDSVNAEYAVSAVLCRIATHFTHVEDAYISERAADIRDIERRLLWQLLGRQREDLTRLDRQVVVVARELSPTQTAGFDREHIRGLATDAGGRTSHTAIVARSLGIPAVVALEDLVQTVRSAERIIVDGNRGIVIVDPDEATLTEYRRSLESFSAMGQRLAGLRDKPAETRDGERIALLGNIEFPDEADLVARSGGDGVGLYRTEFLYLNRPTEPTEAEHYEAYTQTLAAFPDRPVTIRTLDLGADKYTQSQRLAPEPNPFLGLRSIRYCLRNVSLFRTQLRAILRASTRGRVRIMFPLITNLLELRQAKTILRDVMEDLHEEGVAYAADPQVGIMIETPAAALTAATLSRESDFFSIGTNDLIQYTLAVDRGNEWVSNLYSAAEPAVLRLIRTVVQDAHKARIDVSVCGEMGSEPEYVMLLLGLGLRSLSISPPMIPEIKQIVRSVTIEECNRVARKVLTMNAERQIAGYLRGRARDILPEAF